MKDYEENYWAKRAGHYNKTSWVKNEDFIDIDKNGLTKRIRKYQEYFTNKEIEVLDIMDNGIVDNTPLYIVPKGHFFVM